ncbi:MAG: pyrroloquinoline quinone biosynthesis peptide chaperone PqqD [Albidovulum sp.]
MDAAAIPALPRGVRVHFDRVRGIWVLLAPERTVTLDPIGQAILAEVDGRRNFGEITAALATKYAAPLDQIATDCASFLDALRERLFLEVRP